MTQLGRHAAATARILRRRALDEPGEWTPIVVLLRAGVHNPRACVAQLRNAGHTIEERNPRPYSAFIEYRYGLDQAVQLSLAEQRDAGELGERE